MSTREKIIVALMVVAIGYGIFTFWSWRDDQSLAEKKLPAGTVDWVTALKTRIEKETLAASEKNDVQVRVEGAWAGDPFLDRQLVAALEKEIVQKQSPAVAADKLGLKYTGYLAAGQKVLAVINGIEYETGEKLEIPGDFILQSITQSQVVVFREGTGQKIAIPLEETTY